MVLVKSTEIIYRPVSEVFDYVMNFNNVPLWQSNVLEAQITTSGPVGVGSKIHWVQTFLGKKFESTFEIVEYKQNEIVRFKGTSGPIVMNDGRYIFESVEGGTRFTQSINGEPKGFFKVADAIATRMYQRQVNSNFKNLKELMEATERVTA